MYAPKVTLKKILLFSLAIVISTLFLTSFKGQGKTSTKKILVVQSYNQGYPSYRIWDKELKRALKANNIKADLRTIYLDCNRYDNEGELEHMYNLLCELQKDWTPDLIMVNDDQGCFSLLSCNHPWENEIPVVFGGVNYPNAKLLSEHKNVTGMKDSIDIETNLRKIAQFQSKVSKLHYTMIFLDSTYLERLVRKDLEKLVTEKNQDFNYIDRSSLLTDSAETDFELTKVYSHGYKNFVQKIEEAKDKINIFGTRVRKESGANIMWNCAAHEDMVSSYLKLTANISTETAESFCQKPKFTAINELFGAGRHYAAGYLTTLNIQADEMCQLAKKIFDGVSPSDIPIKVSAKEYVADWEGFKYYNLNPSDIGSDVRIINMPFYIKYKWTIIGLVALIFLLNIHTILDLYRKKKREEKLKKEAQDELAIKNQQLLESLAELKRQYQELQEVRKMVEKAELKQSFLDSMSHEIRTPLNAIVGFSNLLVEDSTANELSNDEKKEFMSLIQTNTELLLKLVNDILEISRIESGNIPIEITRCNTQEVFATICKEQSLSLFNKELKLENDNKNSTIAIDCQRFKQVITNLLNNADKFTEKGTITLGCRFNDKDNTVSFYVRDTGLGMKEEEKKMIFRRFYKIDPFSQGTGLGLSISLTIMEKMHGTITVDSELGKGSCFYATVPALKK